MKSELYSHYRELLKDATPYEADLIIGSAFNDYLKDRITAEEYSAIYFAAVPIANGTSSACKS